MMSPVNSSSDATFSRLYVSSYLVRVTDTALVDNVQPSPSPSAY